MRAQNDQRMPMHTQGYNSLAMTNDRQRQDNTFQRQNQIPNNNNRPNDTQNRAYIPIVSNYQNQQQGYNNQTQRQQQEPQIQNTSHLN